jgi:hypothetical protein
LVSIKFEIAITKISPSLDVFKSTVGTQCRNQAFSHIPSFLPFRRHHHRYTRMHG